MPGEFRRRSSSIYAIRQKSSESSGILQKKISLAKFSISIGNVVCLIFSLLIISLQSLSLLTAHWKEISPTTSSLYIDGIDALIRSEVFAYFNSVHRSTRYSFGLFHRCSSSMLKSEELKRKCSKNFLPSYNDEQFDQCHSLQYYDFCSKTNGEFFDIYNDFLRRTFGLSSSSSPTKVSPSSFCPCHYPIYLRVCQIIGILAFIFSCFTFVLSIVFPLVVTRRQRMTVKCFVVLSAILSTLSMFVTLLVSFYHLQFESLEFLTSIERNYRLNQIYKLSQDTKISIERFLSSIEIDLGYSSIVAGVSIVLSLINAVLLMISLKIETETNMINLKFHGISRDSINDRHYESEEQESTTMKKNSPHEEELLPPTIVLPPIDKSPSPSSSSLSTPSKRHSIVHIRFRDQT